MTSVRSRSRAVDLTGAGKAQPTPEIIAKTQAVFRANREKNVKTREENALKKELLKMVAAVKGLTRFMVQCDGKHVEVKYEPAQKETVNAAKLLKLVGDVDRVLAIASFSQKDVTEAFGTNVLAQCLDSAPDDHKLSVKEYKD